MGYMEGDEEEEKKDSVGQMPGCGGVKALAAGGEIRKRQ
jgi:hypothetical protein